MTKKSLIEKLKLQIQILKLQIQILLLRKKLTVPNLGNPKYLVVHHGGGSWEFAKVNDYHKELWGFKSSLGHYCGYHYFISYLGDTIQARRDNEKGAHCVEKRKPHWWNENSIGVCLQGNFEKENPTMSQLSQLELLIKRKMTEYNIPKNHILGHKDISATLCPGKNLYQWLTDKKI